MIVQNFVPVRAHVRTAGDLFKRMGERFGVQWTPTTLVVDATGQERHRIEGFLPADDFAGQLALGRGHAAFARGEFAEAAQIFSNIVNARAEPEIAAEARYWYGVAQYKITNDPKALHETAREIQQQYASTTWAKKSSVWA
jgi:hypothetical protein